MSLYQRLAAVLLAVLMLLAAGAFSWPVWALRAGLQVEQAERNAETAQALAQVWTPLQSDVAGLQAAAEARWAAGREDRIVLRAASDRLLLKLQRAGDNPAVPSWFSEAWPLSVPPGVAPIGSGITLEVQSSLGRTQALLWAASSRAAVGLAACFVLAAGAGLLLLRWTLRPWAVTLRQLQGLNTGHILPWAETAPPEIDALARSLNATVLGLRADLAREAEQVALLRHQAQVDGMTGLALRHHFLELLQERLSLLPSGGGAHAALLLVRLPGLSALNLRLGHATTDRLLCAAAHVLLTYVDRVPGALAGRLNGSDFALFLPVSGLALETAQSLHEALAALPALRSARTCAVVGGVDALPRSPSGWALAEADAALARAEAGEGGGVAIDQHRARSAEVAGASAWHSQIAGALDEGRALLHEELVCDRQGRVLHRACTLRLQLGAGGQFQAIKRWAALARRGHLISQAELLTLRQVLLAMAHDGQPRSLRFLAESLLSPRFVSEVRAQLQGSPTQSRRLSIEIAETERLQAPQDLKAALAAWHAEGVQLGVLHSGGTPQDLSVFPALGVVFVTVGAQHLRGIAADSALRSHAESLFKLLHGLALKVLADRVLDGRDLDVLWSLGLDGVMSSGLEMELHHPGLGTSGSVGAPALGHSLQFTSPACSV